MKTETYCDLLTQADAMCDNEEYVLSGELFLLRKIASTSSDLVKAREWEEFAQINGGLENFEIAHRAAVGAWEQWHHDGDG